MEHPPTPTSALGRPSFDVRVLERGFLSPWQGSKLQSYSDRKYKEYRTCNDGKLQHETVELLSHQGIMFKLKYRTKTKVQHNIIWHVYLKIKWKTTQYFFFKIVISLEVRT